VTQDGGVATQQQQRVRIVCHVCHQHMGRLAEHRQAGGGGILSSIDTKVDASGNHLVRGTDVYIILDTELGGFYITKSEAH